MDISAYFEEAGGVVGAPQMADFFGVSTTTVRDWAHATGVPRVGAGTFAFTEDAAREFARDVLGVDDDDEAGEWDEWDDDDVDVDDDDDEEGEDDDDYDDG